MVTMTMKRESMERYAIRRKWKKEGHPAVGHYLKRFYDKEESLEVIDNIETQIDQVAEEYGRDLEKEVPLKEHEFTEHGYPSNLELNKLNALLKYDSEELTITAKFDHKEEEEQFRFGRRYLMNSVTGRNKIEVQMKADTSEVSDEEFEAYDEALQELGFK